MRIALCTTTINVPHVLKLYRACDPLVKMFVAHDIKTPPPAYELLAEIGAEVSTGHDYRCSELIGFNSIQRRNMAFLDALKWGADVIVSIDDDNLPLAASYCWWHEDRLSRAYDGIIVLNGGLWFDVGTLLRPQAKHRGFPNSRQSPQNFFTHTTGAKIGVSAGICLGDPDIDAVTRIANAPEVHQVSQVLEAGVACSSQIWTVFNSQNTAVLRELVPAWGMVPFVGRMDDIYASLIVQRVMRERNMHIHFGKPFVLQQRNAHNLVKDLRGEIDGYEDVERLADVLDHTQLPGKSVIGDCRVIWETLNNADFIPGRTVSAMMAYIDDCEAVL